jgi:hypothetical protein
MMMNAVLGKPAILRPSEIEARTIISTGQTRSIDDEHDPPAKA